MTGPAGSGAAGSGSRHVPLRLAASQRAFPKSSWRSQRRPGARWGPLPPEDAVPGNAASARPSWQCRPGSVRVAPCPLLLLSGLLLSRSEPVPSAVVPAALRGHGRALCGHVRAAPWRGTRYLRAPPALPLLLVLWPPSPLCTTLCVLGVEATWGCGLDNKTSALTFRLLSSLCICLCQSIR